ncbi:MAG: hypothetical protein ACR2MG_18070 [Pyrinomonadaceae bacterium]
MKTSTKVLLSVGGIFVFIVFIVIAVIAALVYSVSESSDFEEYQKNRGTAQAEGQIYGRKTDNNGCIEEGLLRSKNMPYTDVLKVGVNEAFVEECLKASRPVNNFCEGIPYVWGVGNWRKKQCQNAGMDENESGCESVFFRKRQYCIFDKK